MSLTLMPATIFAFVRSDWFSPSFIDALKSVVTAEEFLSFKWPILLLFQKRRGNASLLVGLSN